MNMQVTVKRPSQAPEEEIVIAPLKKYYLFYRWRSDVAIFMREFYASSMAEAEEQVKRDLPDVFNPVHCVWAYIVWAEHGKLLISV